MAHFPEPSPDCASRTHTRCPSAVPGSACSLIPVVPGKQSLPRPPVLLRQHRRQVSPPPSKQKFPLRLPFHFPSVLPRPPSAPPEVSHKILPEEKFPFFRPPALSPPRPEFPRQNTRKHIRRQKILFYPYFSIWIFRKIIPAFTKSESGYEKSKISARRNGTWFWYRTFLLLSGTDARNSGRSLSWGSTGTPGRIPGVSRKPCPLFLPLRQ